MSVKKLLGGAVRNLSVERAYGPAYEKDGRLIIPVAMVAGGGGGGGGTSRSQPDEDGPLADSSDGEGGGFGGVIWPIGVYAANDDEVRFIPSINVTLLVLAALATIRVLSRRRRRAHR